MNRMRMQRHSFPGHTRYLSVYPALIPLLLCILLFAATIPAYAIVMDSALQLTPEEITWIEANRNNIRYGPNPSWPPGDYMEDGVHKGIVSDYIKIFEQKLGLTFKRVYYNDWEHFYGGLKNAEVDLVGACQETEERKKFLVFTQPFLKTRLTVLTRTNRQDINSLNDLNSMTLSGIQGYSSLDYVKSKYPGAKIVECDDDLTVLLKVSAGAVDGAIIDYMVASYLVDKYSITNIKYAMELDFHWDLRFAIRIEKPQLRSIIDKVLNTINEDERQKIYHRWVSIKLEHKPGFFERYLKIILGIFLSLLFLLFVVLIFNQSLKKQVFTRTKELELSTDKLRESKEYLEAVLNSAGDTIIVSDAYTGQIIDVNHRMVEMYGYSYQESLKVEFRDLSQGEPPYSEVEAREWFRKAREINPQTFDWLSRHKDGHTFWVEVKIRFSVIGEANRFVIVVRDNTERKQMEEQLMKAQKLEALGVLAGGIAHDFNNILTPIIGLSELLIEDYSRDNVVWQSAQNIYTAGKRGSDLVRQIMTFSRQSGQEKIPVRIQPILKEVIKLCRSTIPANISIIQHIENDCSMIEANPSQIHQIALNLITNGYHAVEPKNGKIVVLLSDVEIRPGQRSEMDLLPGRYVLLSVSDTGTGIEPDIINKIFEPYFTTKGQGKGTGLGLAVVYGIVKELQGDIKVTSKLGKGTTFDVYFPITANPAEPVSTGKTDEYAPGDERILLVDDYDAVAFLSTKILEQLGYKVTMCLDSLEALEIFKSKPDSFDLVISDMSMPNLTGDQLVRELKAIRPDIPVIICTGYSERMNQEKAVQIGVKGLLMKPIIRADLAKMVRMVLDTSKENAK